MDRTTLPVAPRVSPWLSASVVGLAEQTHRVRSLFLRPPEPMPFNAGQHIDVRLTADDGYQAQRSYSIASGPHRRDELEIAVELIADGEVSPYFHDVVECGDEIEIRGPIGSPFTWTPELEGPLLLVAGGSGIAPLMSILRHQQREAPDLQSTLLYSSRSIDDIIFMAELDELEQNSAHLAIVHTLTRTQPETWSGFSRRVDGDMLTGLVERFDESPNCFICGPTGFVEAVADHLVALAIPPAQIRTERFGPT